MRLLTALDRYVTQLHADGRSANTIDQYRRYIRFLDEWLRAGRRTSDVRSVTAETLAEFLTSAVARTRPDGQPKREVSVNALRSSLRAFFAYCHAAGYAPRNAAQLIRRARCASPPPRALSDEDSRRLLATLKAANGEIARRDELLFQLMLATGIRLGSALALEARDVDLGGGEMTLRLMKGDRPDRLQIPRTLLSLLRCQLRVNGTGAIFRGSRAVRLSPRQARRRLAFWLRRAGVTSHASPHSLRHTFAARLYDQTHDLLRVQRSLCHASPSSTAIYATRHIGGMRRPRGCRRGRA